ncbi:MAG: tRNA dihydrouridine(20/20a) synthase DusA [Proteobacteria bacterium]|nr:tRNA dihydrouridine(20/20a) synthase DusA [Pseudomonadota bacterium]
MASEESRRDTIAVAQSIIKQQRTSEINSWRFSVAPMMDWTDRHCRFFHRLMTRHALLYTEMVTSGAVIHGDRARLLGFSPEEHPVALQLGGSDPAELARAAKIGAEFGYDEINLNCGCPSDRVQNGRFGACLMREPALVAQCVSSMKAAVPVPVTVKCRIGVDDQNPEEALFTLAEAVFAAGCDALIVHARKAWLQGLSPKENRDIPPLDYAIVRRLKARWPAKPIAINGGIADLATAQSLLVADAEGPALDGVMLGRAAYQNPAILLGVDAAIFGAAPKATTPFEVLEKLIPYLERLVGEGHSPHALTRHVLGLFQSVPGARAFRRHLSTEAVKAGAQASVLREAMALVRREAREAA